MDSASRFSYDPAEFAGKRVLVTGGTEGMGRAIVQRLRRQWCDGCNDCTFVPPGWANGGILRV